MPAFPVTMEPTGEDFRLFIPISKVDVERREVVGCATAELEDKQHDILAYEGSKEAFDKWGGNVREMHQPNAVGKRVSQEFDNDARQVIVTARISKGAEDTWQKVLDGTLTGYSVGGRSRQAVKETVRLEDGTQRERRRVQKYDLSELSLVDSPALPGATFTLVKSEGGVLSQTAVVEDEPERTDVGDLLRKSWGELSLEVVQSRIQEQAKKLEDYKDTEVLHGARSEVPWAIALFDKFVVITFKSRNYRHSYGCDGVEVMLNPARTEVRQDWVDALAKGEVGQPLGNEDGLLLWKADVPGPGELLEAVSDLIKGWMPADVTQTDLDDGDFLALSDAYKKGEASKSEGRRFPYKVHGKANPAGWMAAHTALAGGHGYTSLGAGWPSNTEMAHRLEANKPEGVEKNPDGGYSLKKADGVEADDKGKDGEGEKKPKRVCPQCGWQGDEATCPECDVPTEEAVGAPVKPPEKKEEGAKPETKTKPVRKMACVAVLDDEELGLVKVFVAGERAEGFNAIRKTVEPTKPIRAGKFAVTGGRLVEGEFEKAGLKMKMFCDHEEDLGDLSPADVKRVKREVKWGRQCKACEQRVKEKGPTTSSKPFLSHVYSGASKQ